MTLTDGFSEFKPKSTAVVTRYLRRMFKASGLDAEQIFELSEIDVSRFSDSSYRISHDKLLKMWEVAGELSGDPDFGLHLAEKVPMAPFNAAGYLAMTSKNLREAINSIKKYIKIFTDDGHVYVDEGKKITKVRIDLSGGVGANRQHSDFWQLYFYRNYNAMIGWEVPLVEAGFIHKKPESIKAYENVFKCMLEFDRKENYIKFPSVYLDYQTISSDSSMHKVHEIQASQQLSALTEIGIVNKVRKAIFEALPDNDIHLNQVAELLNLTPRTVQRNLASEGSSFKELVDDARKEYTFSEMKNTDFSVAEVAYRLGYKDLSSFYRAFKRWTGSTPNDYRKNLIQ